MPLQCFLCCRHDLCSGGKGAGTLTARNGKDATMAFAAVVAVGENGAGSKWIHSPSGRGRNASVYVAKGGIDSAVETGHDKDTPGE